MRRALQVLTVSEFSRSELIELAGLDPGADQRRPRRRRRPLHAGRGPDGARPTALGLHRPYVLTVATDDRRKNLGLARRDRAAAAVRRASTWRGPATSGRISPTSQRHSPARALLGYVDDDRLPGLYRGALGLRAPVALRGPGAARAWRRWRAGRRWSPPTGAALPETCGDAALLVDPDDRDGAGRTPSCVRAPTKRCGPDARPGPGPGPRAHLGAAPARDTDASAALRLVRGGANVGALQRLKNAVSTSGKSGRPSARKSACANESQKN